MADGGFVGNKDEIKRTLAIDPDDLYSMGERKATGDGLQMLKEAGGVSDYKGIFENHAATVYSKTDPKWHNASLFDLTNLTKQLSIISVSKLWTGQVHLKEPSAC